MSKTFYLYDELASHEYAGHYEAQESPLEPGEYIRPTNATDIEPLPFKAGFAICFNNGVWEYQTDSRGVWFKPNRDIVEVDKLDDVIDPLWTREPLPKTAEELAAEVAVEAKRLKELALKTITVTVSSGKVFDGNETARTNMLSAITAASYLGQTTANWKLADNTVANVSLDEVKEALALSIQRVGEIVTA